MKKSRNSTIKAEEIPPRCGLGCRETWLKMHFEGVCEKLRKSGVEQKECVAGKKGRRVGRTHLPKTNYFSFLCKATERLRHLFLGLT